MDIDFDILGDLTDPDLEKIGVNSLGHRRKLLRAIANLKGVEQITRSSMGQHSSSLLPDLFRCQTHADNND
jgi:hypothetical protein